MKLPEEKALSFQISPKLRMIALALVGVGLALVLAQLIPGTQVLGHGAEGHAEGGHEAHYPRLFASLHLALLVALPLGLGGLYFVAFNNLAGAAWCVTIRRIAENYFWFLGFVLILMIIVFAGGLGSVFSHWVHPHNPNDALLAWKKPWLNAGFFVSRNIIFVIVWLLFGFLLWKKSTGQDADSDFSRTRSMAKWSAGFIIVFALSYSASAFDLSMSLDPHWYSTLWAAYQYAGLALTAFASLILWIWYLKSAGYFGESLNENHYHDMGKYMWGHSIFWAYCMICQYLLIWYAHIPEETIFYRKRIYDDAVGFQPWAIVSLLMILVRFVVPFFLIIQRKAKRNIKHLGIAAIVVLVGQIIDVYWVLYPTLTPDSSFIMFSWQEIGPLLVVAGSFILITGWALSRNSLIPKGDPRLEECLHWHQ